MTIKPVSKKLNMPWFLFGETSNTVLPHDTIFCIDGYHIAERLLEVVYFRETLSEDRQTLIVLGVDCPKYLEDLNSNKWMNEALEYFTNEHVSIVCENDKSKDWSFLSEKTLKEYQK